MHDPRDDVAKELDKVIGTAYDSLAEKGALKRRLAKWVAGTLFAILAACAIIFVIETHRLPPNPPQPAVKPVPIQIVPEPQQRNPPS